MATPWVLSRSAAEGTLLGEALGSASGLSEGSGFAEDSALADGAALASGAAVDSWLVEASLPAWVNPSLGRIRKATTPMANATIPTARMGHSFRRTGTEASRWTPCREAAS